MTHTEAIERIDQILADIPNIPDAGADFAESVEEKLSSIRETISKKGRVTDRQEDAIENMGAGVMKWVDRDWD